MKKVTIYLFAIIVALNSFCQEFIEFEPSDNTEVSYDVLVSDNTMVEFEVELPGIYSNEVDSFIRVEIKNHAKLDSTGFPEVPKLSFLVAIPVCDGFILTVDLIDSVKVDGINIYPAPAIVEDSTGDGFKFLREEFVYNQTAYSTDSYFPGIYAESLDKGAVRAQQCVRVFLYPVQFNPVLQQINACSKMKVTLTFTNPTGPVNENVGIFNEMLGNTMINYISNGLNASVSCGAGDGTYNPEDYWVTSLPSSHRIEDPCDYLIITAGEFFDNPDLYNLAIHREIFNGFDVKIITRTVIDNDMPGTILYLKIRDLIKNTYSDGIANNTFDGKLAYVNLFGDVELENDPFDGIPTSDEGYDIFYSQLTPGDPLPDIMIGRCSADDAVQVHNVVTKILNFEPETMVGNENMLTVLGDDNNFYTSQSGYLNDMDNISLLGCYTKKFMIPPDFSYPLPEWINVTYAGQTIPIEYENGLMFLNYFGHGASEYWGISTGFISFSYSNLNTSQHIDRIPFIFSSACCTGSFHTSDNCMAEQFLCYNSNMGSIGFLGSSRVTSSESFVMVPDCYHSIFNNFSFVQGESVMEVKIADYDIADYNIEGYTGNWCKDFNLFGDPALNIMYENTDEINPDLAIKKSEIFFDTELIQFGEVVTIDAVIRNYSWKEAASFNVNCYLGDPSLSGSILLGSNQIVELNAYEYETISFTWNTEEFGADIYDIYIVIDPENVITEMNYENNKNFRTKAIYYFHPNFPVTNYLQFNSHVIAFDVDDENAGTEIMHGQSIFTIEGEQLNPFNVTQTIGNTCIANLSNNANNQIIHTTKKPNPKITSAGNPSWLYNIDGSKYTPIVLDIDNDGYEEVICLSLDAQSNASIYCLDNVGELRWFIDDFTDEEYVFYPGMITGNFNGEYNSIIFIDRSGIFKHIYESPVGEPYVSTYQVLTDCDFLVTQPIASDINKDGIVEIIFIYKPVHSQNRRLANINAYDFTINSIVEANYSYDYTTNINPIISDINNDGHSEIMVGNVRDGFYIYNMDLDLLNYIPDDNLTSAEITTGDINNNGILDIICETKNNDFHVIKGYDINGDQTFSTPVIGIYESCWLDDINNDEKIDFVYGIKDELYVVNLPSASDIIGWPGQRSNLRNTGVYEQPSFYGENGETVYWMNRIILSPDEDNIIPKGSTVVIKPGTQIYAHSGSSLIVHGTLIAQGTEDHPIIFTSDIVGSDDVHWQGITLCNRSYSTIEHVYISNAEFGLLYEDFSEQTLENCRFNKNLIGVGAFNSSPDIYKCNFEGNGKAIGSYSNGSPILCSFGDKKYYNTIINNNIGIYISSGSVYLHDGYNDIYNHPAYGYYIYCTNDSYIKAPMNYWGTINIPEIQERLYPSESIFIKPICEGPNTSYKSGSIIEEMLGEAYQYLDSADYANAGIKFKEIITDYPLENEAYMSVPGLFSCYSATNENWGDLETYLEMLYNDTIIVLDKKLTFGYLNLCKRAQGKFSEAIANYESILLNSPTYNDSVFAVINIGNTYEEAGNSKSSLGSLDYLQPISNAAHVENTIDLLQTLKDEELSGSQQSSDDFFISDIYPNPFIDKTTLRYFASYTSTVTFRLFDVSGKELSFSQTIQAIKGEQSINLDFGFLNPGIYYISLIANGENQSVKRLVVK